MRGEGRWVLVLGIALCVGIGFGSSKWAFADLSGCKSSITEELVSINSTAKLLCKTNLTKPARGESYSSWKSAVQDQATISLRAQKFVVEKCYDLEDGNTSVNLESLSGCNGLSTEQMSQAFLYGVEKAFKGEESTDSSDDSDSSSDDSSDDSDESEGSDYPYPYRHGQVNRIKRDGKNYYYYKNKAGEWVKAKDAKDAEDRLDEEADEIKKEKERKELEEEEKAEEERKRQEEAKLKDRYMCIPKPKERGVGDYLLDFGTGLLKAGSIIMPHAFGYMGEYQRGKTARKLAKEREQTQRIAIQTQKDVMNKHIETNERLGWPTKLSGYSGGKNALLRTGMRNRNGFSSSGRIVMGHNGQMYMMDARGNYHAVPAQYASQMMRGSAPGASMYLNTGAVTNPVNQILHGVNQLQNAQLMTSAQGSNPYAMTGPPIYGPSASLTIRPGYSATMHQSPYTQVPGAQMTMQLHNGTGATTGYGPLTPGAWNAQGNYNPYVVRTQAQVDPRMLQVQLQQAQYQQQALQAAIVARQREALRIQAYMEAQRKDALLQQQYLRQRQQLYAQIHGTYQQQNGTTPMLTGDARLQLIASGQTGQTNPYSTNQNLVNPYNRTWTEPFARPKLTPTR